MLEAVPNLLIANEQISYGEIYSTLNDREELRSLQLIIHRTHLAGYKLSMTHRSRLAVDNRGRHVDGTVPLLPFGSFLFLQSSKLLSIFVRSKNR